MKDTIKLDLIELLESGKTHEESNEVQLIVDASDEALKFIVKNIWFPKNNWLVSLIKIN